MSESTLEKIDAVIGDLIMDFLYYGRQNDDYLPKGEIEKAIESGEIAPLQIANIFKTRILDEFAP